MRRYGIGVLTASAVTVCLALIAWPAHAQQSDDKILDEFIGKTLPTLRTYTKEELRLDTIIKDLKERSDIVVFAYATALTKAKAPMNSWNGEVKRETGFIIYVLCQLAKYVGLPPKDENYRKEMERARRTLYEGSFERTIARLSIRKAFFETSYITAEKEQKLPPFEQLVNPKWLGKEQVETARGLLR